MPFEQMPLHTTYILYLTGNILLISILVNFDKKTCT